MIGDLIVPIKEHESSYYYQDLCLSGDIKTYFTFITSEVYYELEKWMDIY